MKKPDQEILGRIGAETERLTTLISDLQELSRAESGKLSLEKKSVDLNALVEEVLFKFEKQIAEKEIQVETGTTAMPHTHSSISEQQRLRTVTRGHTLRPCRKGSRRK